MYAGMRPQLAPNCVEAAPFRSRYSLARPTDIESHGLWKAHPGFVGSAVDSKHVWIKYEAGFLLQNSGNQMYQLVLSLLSLDFSRLMGMSFFLKNIYICI